MKPNSLKEISLPYIAPALLIVVALNQVLHANLDCLTPWKGGGFGMFSSTTSASNRWIVIKLHTDKESIPVACPRRYRMNLAKIKAFPKRNRLEDFGSDLITHNWVDFGVVAGRIKPKTNDQDPGKENSWKSDEVDLWSSVMNSNDVRKKIEPVRFLAIEDEKYTKLPTGKLLDVKSISLEVWNLNFTIGKASFEKLDDVTIFKN